jgi:hypothetical protein
VPVVINFNTRARLLLNERIVLAEDAFAELVLWRVPRPVTGSSHAYKFRLAYVVEGVCVVRFDNEAGKGDHAHIGHTEYRVAFDSVEALMVQFRKAIERWNHENGRT